MLERHCLKRDSFSCKRTKVFNVMAIFYMFYECAMFKESPRMCSKLEHTSWQVGRPREPWQDPKTQKPPREPKTNIFVGSLYIPYWGYFNLIRTCRNVGFGRSNLNPKNPKNRSGHGMQVQSSPEAAGAAQCAGGELQPFRLGGGSAPNPKPYLDPKKPSVLGFLNLI